MKTSVRWTIRLRLTLLYGGMFFLAGAFLLILTYALVGRAQPPPDRPFFEAAPALPPDATFEQRRQEAEILFAQRQASRNAWLESIRTQSAIALVLTSVGAIALGWVVAGRVLSPIRQITAHAQQFSSLNLGERIDLQGPHDELRELADTMDAMLDRLQAAFESQRYFSAQVSHELRTPLSIIRAEADVALADPAVTERETELATRVRTAVGRCEGLVDALLALARSDSTMHDRFSLDLADLAGDVVGEYLQAASLANVRMELELNTATVVGDRALLERMIANLVDNAVRYNAAGGWVRVSVARSGPNASLRVENSGPKLTESELATLTTPFQRGRRHSFEEGSGYGLGLAIVRAVAAAHDGAVHLQAREEGGLDVEVSLPAEDASTT